MADAGAALVSQVATRRAVGAGEMYLRHLSRVLGRDLSPEESLLWTASAFRGYARYWMEGARLGSTSPKVIDSRMSVAVGWDEFRAAMSAGNGVVMALPHVGSWEWGGAWLALKGYPMTSVAEPAEPPELSDWLVGQRQRMGLRILPLGSEVGPALLQTLRDGKLVGLLCDRDVVGGGIEVEFFGERTTLPAGPATLALRTGAALMPTVVYSGPGKHHTAEIHPALDTTRQGRLRADVARVTQCLAHELEKLIRQAPDQWHLFQPNWPSDPGYEQIPR